MVELLLFAAVVCASLGIVAVTCILYWYMVERPRLYQCKHLGRLSKENGCQNDIYLNQDNHKLRSIHLAFKANELA